MFLMSIIVQILGETPEDIQAQGAAYFDVKSKGGRPAANKAEKAAAGAEGGAAAGGVAPPSAAGGGVSFDDFFKALGEFDTKFGRLKSKEVLKKYGGATKSSEVKPEYLAAITAELRAGIGAGTPPAAAASDEL